MSYVCPPYLEECEAASAITPPISNNGNAMWISPPSTIPIKMTGKKTTVQSSFRIPQDALSPNIKNFPTKPIIQIVNNNDNITFSFWLYSIISRSLFLLFFYKSGCIFHANLITEIGILFYFVNLT